MVVFLYYYTNINLYFAFHQLIPPNNIELKAEFNSESLLHLKELMHWGTLQCSCPNYPNYSKYFDCLPSQ